MKPNSEYLASEYIAGRAKEEVANAEFFPQGIALGIAQGEAKSAPADHFAISSGEQQSADAAWEAFWEDYDRKIRLVDEKEYQNIFWRMKPRYETLQRRDDGSVVHKVGCRFSLL
ncbi:MAG: hypothetical protein GWN86_10700 [Desulfobacterales bacterium]|nr:hypothetical protein [Desulfobacterales bacterium]